MINTQITYSSTIMKITCPNCGAMGKVKAKVPPKHDLLFSALAVRRSSWLKLM